LPPALIGSAASSAAPAAVAHWTLLCIWISIVFQRVIWLRGLLLTCHRLVSAILGLLLAGAVRSAETAAVASAAPFEQREVMVPMRDGVMLQTVIWTPVGASAPLPIMLTRTPYGVPDHAPETVPAALRELAADGYIFVIQNLRGRFQSGGDFSLSDDSRLRPGHGTIETEDAWDSIDWLVHFLCRLYRRRQSAAAASGAEGGQRTGLAGRPVAE
jgi:hypothetical protein